MLDTTSHIRTILLKMYRWKESATSGTANSSNQLELAAISCYFRIRADIDQSGNSQRSETEVLQN